MARQAIAKLCNMFENGCAYVGDAYSEGRPSTSTNAENVARVNERILANRCSTVDEIANELDILYGSVHKIIVDHLEFLKICA
ncbi:hypothetical protein AVEN_249908-1 [Araneus ventricosus]|uniref:Uncharacterized protein n=1 Tax=Araneus ventricosus TaxID=182803 RepID=A0A4Y2WBG9_ARAVE|nr:hypothetical protein AVEN_47904-1 [Araneus ventricosus]GBO36320.1 hypothetical protein AVEN_249908-1 [Araneus ventricosus]